MTLYPNTCFTNKDVRIYRQTHFLKTARIAADLSKPRGQMTLVENFKRQRLIEEGLEFLGIDDFNKLRAVLFHVPKDKGKTKQMRDIL